jgi:hypothetical protein
MFDCYLKLQRSQTVKKDGTTSKTPRYVVTAIAGYYKPLNELKNAKGEIVMFYTRNDKSNPKSTAATRLQCNCKGSVNFSSLYFEDLQANGTAIAYGEPPSAKELKNGKKGTKPNPFYGNSDVGFLFIVSPDANAPETIEILVLPNSRNTISGLAKKMTDGQFDEAINQVRNAAKPM